MDFKTQFQTPPPVAEYMASLMPVDYFDNLHTAHILEPTPGIGNIVKAIEKECLKPEAQFGYKIHAPKNFFEIKRKTFDCIIMNPPFSEKHAFGIPQGIDLKGMRVGYYMLTECMKKSDHIIALMPWFTLIDSDVRMRALKEFGLKSVTALPRKTFEYSRIQTCVLELVKGRNRQTEFKTFDF